MVAMTNDPAGPDDAPEPGLVEVPEPPVPVDLPEPAVEETPERA